MTKHPISARTSQASTRRPASRSTDCIRRIADQSPIEIDDHGIMHGDGVTYIACDKRQQLATIDGHIGGLVWHWTDTRGAGAVNLAKRIAVPGGAARSCHAWIDATGAIAQSVPFTFGSWHAGSQQAALYAREVDGTWRMLTPAEHGKVRGYGANSWTGGIELENVGEVRQVNGVWRGWPFGRVVAGEGLGTVVPNAEVQMDGNAYVPGAARGHHRFSDAQIESARRVAAAVIRRYGLSRDACAWGHVQVDPENRTDPGPLWMGDAGKPNAAHTAKLGGHLAEILDGIFGPERVAPTGIPGGGVQRSG